jgi:hypothetical protein
VKKMALNCTALHVIQKDFLTIRDAGKRSDFMDADGTHTKVSP